MIMQARVGASVRDGLYNTRDEIGLICDRSRESISRTMHIMAHPDLCLWPLADPDLAR